MGDDRSDLVVGLIGALPAARKLSSFLGEVATPVRIDGGRTGVGIALSSVNREGYDELLRRAASAALDGIDLVLLAPQDGSTDSTRLSFPASSGRPDPSHPEARGQD